MAENYICHMELVATLKELERAAAQFLGYAGSARVFAISGMMGGGENNVYQCSLQIAGSYRHYRESNVFYH